MKNLKGNIITVLKTIVSFSSFVWLAVLMFIIDIVSKQIVLNTMEVGQSIQLIPNFLSINYVINDGMAFGIDFRNAVLNRVMFAVISLIGAIILIGVFSYKYSTKTKLVKISLMLMISGCIGNLIDRAFYSAEYLGYTTNGVVDFIGFRFGNYDFPRFNVADSCLVIGTILLIVWLLISEFKEMLVKRKEEIAELKQDKTEEKVETTTEETTENK
jgi:signal peptidase II